MKNGDEVLKVAYKLTQLDKGPSENIAIFNAAQEGSLAIRRIELNGVKVDRRDIRYVNRAEGMPAPGPMDFITLLAP